MTTYADYTYYTGTYLGTAIASADFAALALRASAVIDRITFQRAAVDFAANENVTAIKNAMCAVAEEIQTIAAEGTSGSVISSETVGSHSVTYAVNSAQYLTDNQRYEAAALLWLEGTYLMFGGFFSDEYGGTLDEA